MYRIRPLPPHNLSPPLPSPATFPCKEKTTGKDNRKGYGTRNYPMWLFPMPLHYLVLT